MEREEAAFNGFRVKVGANKFKFGYQK